MEAIWQIWHSIRVFGTLKKSEWILDADISGCFDNINHDALLKRVPVFRETVRRWLKSGIIEFGKYFQTKSGTPQGGIISPLLANIALDGMERLFGAENSKGNYTYFLKNGSMTIYNDNNIRWDTTVSFILNYQINGSMTINL